MISHSRWMASLLNDEAMRFVLDKPLSWLHLPGTHDSCCYKKRTAGFLVNTQTQDLNLYQQCQLGIRAFDIRLWIDRGSIKARHGKSKDVSDHPWFGPGETMLGQLERFYLETDSEFLVLFLLGTSDSAIHDKGPISEPHLHHLWSHLEEHFKDRAIPRPATPTSPLPTLATIPGSPRRFILVWMQDQQPRRDRPCWQFFNDYAWTPGYGITPEPEDRPSWRGDVYKTGSVDAVTAFIDGNIAADNQLDPWLRPSSRNRFWLAQCQLTPKLPPTQPRDLAWANTFMAEKNFVKTEWIKNTSILSGDFPTTTWVERIVRMNYLLREDGTETKNGQAGHP